MQLRAMIFVFLFMLSSNNDPSIYFILFFGEGALFDLQISPLEQTQNKTHEARVSYFASVQDI